MSAKQYDQVVSINVDVQNDFCPGGSLAVREGDDVVEPLNRLNAWARQSGGQVVFTRDYHPRITNHFGNPPDFVTTWPVHCVQGTEGAQFHPAMHVLPGDIIISKGMVADKDAYSGFDGQSDDGRTLESIITPPNHESLAIVIGGLATDYCVRATVLDALKVADRLRQRGERIGVYAVVDAMRAVSDDGDLTALREMATAGAQLVHSSQVLSGDMLLVGEETGQ